MATRNTRTQDPTKSRITEQPSANEGPKNSGGASHPKLRAPTPDTAAPAFDALRDGVQSTAQSINGVFHDLGRALDEIRCSWFIGEHATATKLAALAENEDVDAFIFEERDRLNGLLASAFGGLVSAIGDTDALFNGLANARARAKESDEQIRTLALVVALVRGDVDRAKGIRSSKAKIDALDRALAKLAAQFGEFLAGGAK